MEEASRPFLRGLSHELANAANSLGVGVELLRLLIDAGELRPAQEALVQVAHGCARVSRLAHGLRELASAQAALVQVVLPGKQLAGRLQETATQLCSPHGVSVTGADDSGDLLVRCDADAIEAAVRGILANAITAGARHVHLAAAPHGGRWVIRIVDDGPGIPVDQVSRLFTPFTRPGRDGDPVALGLWHAREVCRAQDVDLACLDPGAGSTTFALSFSVIDHR